MANKKPPMMRSVGVKETPMMTIKESKMEIYRPSIEFSELELPEIKDWKIGEKYKVIMEIEQVSVKKKDYGPNKGKICAEFKVHKIGILPQKENKENTAGYSALGGVQIKEK